MLNTTILAYIHYLGLMLLFAALVVEHVLCRPGLSVESMQRLIQADKVYGLSAGAMLLSGFLRVVYSSKGLDFYLDNPVFHLKLGVFLLVGLLSIYPTVIFLKWRKACKAGNTAPISAQTLKRITLLLRLELSGMLIMPGLAVLMARGYGL